MNAATDIDLGPLTWVKGEIDQALGRASEALGQFMAGGDATHLKFCRTHVHQVRGALDMVGLDGLTEVTESLEALLLALEEGQPAQGEAARHAVWEGLAALQRYLDELMAGEPHQALRLYPVYQKLAEVRGLPAVHPSALFFPDLSLRPPKPDREAANLSADEARQALRTERAHFQKGLLQWLKQPAHASEARQAMCDALSAIEAVQGTPAARLFWWVARAFLAATASPAVANDPLARQLCSRIDLQMRRLLEGTSLPTERFLREALYCIACAPGDVAPEVAQAQALFGLSALMPAAPAQVLPQAQERALRRLRELLNGLEESWTKVCGQATGSPAVFADLARQCAALTEEIGQTDLKRLGQGVAAIGGWLQESPSRYSELIAMEVATAILLLQSAQENFRRLGGDFAQQVDLMVDRLYGCIAGRPASKASLPVLDDMTRQAQEKLLLGQVGREIQTNLAQVEQTLDNFFRHPEKGLDATLVEAPLKQVAGALAMLGHFAAVNRVKTCISRIEAFAAPDYAVVEADFQAVADQLSIIGFFVEALQHGEKDFERFAARMQAAPENPLAAAETATEAGAAQPAEPTVDRAQDGTIEETPGEAQEGALEAALDGALDQALEDMPAEPEAAALPQLDAPLPSAETLALANASHEAIDAELLAIFLEEASEVLATLGEQKALLAAHPENTDALTTIRRSTHTLKGSGRMVGLSALGETAWALEQTLNLWLRQDQPVTPDLLRMIDDAHTLFSAWVACLAQGSGSPPDPGALVALAAALRGEESLLPGEALPAAAPPTPPTPVPAADDPQLEAAAAALAELLLPETGEAAEPPPAEPVPAPAAAPAARDVQAASPATRVADLAPQSPSAAQTLYNLFREEARGHLQTLVESFALIEATPETATPFEMVRAAHTLGGIAATVGLMPLNRVGVTLERALLRRDASPQPDSIEGLETVRQAILTLESMYDGLARQAAPEDQPQLLDALEGIYLAGQVKAEVPEVAQAVEAAGELPPTAEIIPFAPHPAAVPDIELPEAGPPALPDLPQLTDEIDAQLLPLFLEESADQLREMTEHLRAWQAAPAAEAPPRAIARLLHTFKGNARMAGAMNLGEATHLLETRVQEALAAGSASTAFIEEIEAGCDALAQATERLRAGEIPAEASPEAVSPASEATLPARDGGAEGEAGAQRASLRVRADLIDRLVNEAGELSIARARIEGEMRSLKGSLLDLTENVIRLRRQLRDIEIQAETQIQARVAQSSDGQAEFDPLELDRFTRFQELTRFMAESVNDVATVQQNLLKNLDDANAAILAQARLNRGLQQELMSVRMLPFASQAERLYRIVRQTAKAVGKRASLDIVGGEVEIDRSVLDKIMAPVEHMLRNAVTHGIESRAQRLAVDKPESGEIILKLAQEANEIILTLSDDGAGLDRERIRARAEAMGLLAPGAPLGESALLDLIFQPGFSTATELTQVSGRGVGMDVVKTEVAALGGRIEIASTPGQGSSFRIYLPLTLAVTQTLLVRAGSQRYAIPSTMIEQVLEMKAQGLADLRAAGEAHWQSQVYPFHFLPHLLGDADALPESHRQYWVLLLRSGAQRVAVLVDELKGNQEVVVKNIGPQLSRVVGVAGATVLGDGQVVLILNPVALASRVQAAAALPAAAQPVAQPEQHLPTVMVVDDSLTVRKITSRLLQREGYQVILAKDGVDALEQLVDERPDVILSDIEMPRMDGFDLVRNIRADPRLPGIPIIMITSRTADKHRNHALEIGANHYLGKPYDEAELLGLVAGYCRKTT